MSTRPALAAPQEIYNPRAQAEILQRRYPQLSVERYAIHGEKIFSALAPEQRHNFRSYTVQFLGFAERKNLSLLQAIGLLRDDLEGGNPYAALQLGLLHAAVSAWNSTLVCDYLDEAARRGHPDGEVLAREIKNRLSGNAPTDDIITLESLVTESRSRILDHTPAKKVQAVEHVFRELHNILFTETAELPAKAPEKYADRPVNKTTGKRETIVRFLERVWYDPWIKNGALSRPDLARFDREAEMALRNWLRDRAWPVHLHIPKKTEVLDSYLDDPKVRKALAHAPAFASRKKTKSL